MQERIADWVARAVVCAVFALMLASLALRPQLIWLSTAPVLRLSITRTNRPRRSQEHS